MVRYLYTDGVRLRKPPLYDDIPPSIVHASCSMEATPFAPDVETETRIPYKLPGTRSSNLAVVLVVPKTVQLRCWPFNGRW